MIRVAFYVHGLVETSSLVYFRRIANCRRETQLSGARKLSRELLFGGVPASTQRAQHGLRVLDLTDQALRRRLVLGELPLPHLQQLVLLDVVVQGVSATLVLTGQKRTRDGRQEQCLFHGAKVMHSLGSTVSIPSQTTQALRGCLRW